MCEETERNPISDLTTPSGPVARLLSDRFTHPDPEIYGRGPPSKKANVSFLVSQYGDLGISLISRKPIMCRTGPDGDMRTLRIQAFQIMSVATVLPTRAHLTRATQQITALPCSLVNMRLMVNSLGGSQWLL